jgi:hypothetical protein
MCKIILLRHGGQGAAKEALQTVPNRCKVGA